ncbi:MAG: hypothetical protein AAGJ81_01295 [Verrucomicrobiota bacterium]
MKILKITQESLIVFITSVSFACLSTYADSSVRHSVWSGIGSDVDADVSSVSLSGFTVQFRDESDSRSDIGMRTSFGPVTLREGEKLRMSFRLEGVKTSIGFNNSFRFGFRSEEGNGSTAHASLGYGTPGFRTDSRFGGLGDSRNQFGMGEPFSSVPLGGVSETVFTGREPEIALELELLGKHEEGGEEYQMTLTWDGQTNRSDKFVRFTNRWDSAYILTNNEELQISGDGYTVADFSIELVE